MKIAIIADIHGNLQALEAVLDDIERQHVDRIIVNGDLVNRGPNNLAVMETLWGKGHTMTLGNHDDLVRMWVVRDERLPQSWFSDPFWLATAVSAKELHAAGWIDALHQLQMTFEVAIPGAPKLLISHGSPRHYREGYAFYTSRETMNEIIEAYPADIFIGSHSHRPFDQSVQGRRFLNTGAVGAPFNRDSRAQYLIMAWQNEAWHADFRRVAYDHKAAVAAFDRTGFLEKGKLSAHIFRDELIHSCPFFDPFWRWTHKCQKPRNWDSWNEFRKQVRGLDFIAQ